MILSSPIFLVVVTISIFVAIRVALYRTGMVYIVKKWWRQFKDCFHVYQSFKVPEYNESMQENQLYARVTEYLNTLTSVEDSDFTNLVTGKKPNEIVLQLDPNQIVEDDFRVKGARQANSLAPWSVNFDWSVDWHRLCARQPDGLE